MTLAVMYAEISASNAEIEALVLAGLTDARLAQRHTSELSFMKKLAAIAKAKGEHDEAQRWSLLAKKMEDEDGLTPLERWTERIEMTRWLIENARTRGETQITHTFELELNRLLASKPEP